MSDKSGPDDRSGPADPGVLVIFGAAGDLTKRKLIPALYNLATRKLLPNHFAIIGVARAAMTTDEFRDKITRDIQEFATADVEPAIWDWFVDRLYFVSGHFEDPEVFARLKQQLAQIDQQHSTAGNYFYYLATDPAYFSPIVRQLGSTGLARGQNAQRRHVIIEKPFGRDLESARALNQDISLVLDEKQIYRIDHYLGKETVQNILVFRFGNGIFEPIWNRRYVDHVQITVAESLGVELRGGYYDQSGALRDMVPNHIFQLVSLIAMEPPTSFDANSVRDEQAKILRAIQPLTFEDVLSRAVRGQYGESRIAGQRVAGYRSEPRVAPDSTTETFVALKLLIDNWRWADVPFYVRTGKYLPKRVTEIAIQFKRAPLLLFRKTTIDRLTPNWLVLHIQPDEGISLRFGAKVPGPLLRLGAVDMSFHYADYFGRSTSTGYERLLYDCMIGDATLFQRADMVEAGWSVVASILDVWSALPPRTFPNYAAGTWGPGEADELLERDGRQWRVEK
jgi:glucose-6-phosphate 1-dehydrogenase